MKLPYDKLLHFAVGAAITVLVVIVTGSLARFGWRRCVAGRCR